VSAELDRTVNLRDVRFRPMTIPDVGSVGAIERASYQFPWSEGVFRDCVRVGYLCRVVEYRNEISGYGIMSFGAGEAHVLNICVQQPLRGSGVGRQLMEYLLDRARDEYMQDVFLEVRPSNTVAIQLYESMGFERIGLRKGYYQAVGGREDALVYKLTLEPRRHEP
jgi:ribosomal-protein-alanine N-acetyltransferase